VWTIGLSLERLDLASGDVVIHPMFEPTVATSVGSFYDIRTSRAQKLLADPSDKRSPRQPLPGMDDAALRRCHISPARKLIVKVGSAVVAPDGTLSPTAMAQLAEQLAAIRQRGIHVAVVSSGAVASGFAALGFAKPPTAISHKQAAAAVGQPLLMQAWAVALAKHKLSVAQALFTAEDLADRARYLNARRTMGELLTRGIIPIINENDTVSYTEIQFGDNDMLSALTADLLSAEALIILSKASGLYRDGDARFIVPTVHTTAAHSAAAAKHVRDERSSVGTGGMASKLSAALMSAKWGIPTVVAGGATPQVLTRLLDGEVLGTLFVPSSARIAARQRWLTGAARPKGTIVVDAGAAKALTKQHASLLASGIAAVKGTFGRGAPVAVHDLSGAAIARGITLYSSDEVAKIAGKKSNQIMATLGYLLADEVIHKDDLVLLD